FRYPLNLLDTKMENLAIVSVLIILILLGTIGNTCVLTVFLHIAVKNGELLPSDRSVINMSIVHLLASVFKNILYVFDFFKMHLLNNIGCRLLLYSINLFRTLSISFTLLLSLFQFNKLQNSTYPGINVISLKFEKSICLVSVLLWIISSAIFTPLLFFDDILTLNNSSGLLQFSSCSISPSGGYHLYFGIGTIILVDGFGAFAIVTMNVLILKILWKHHEMVAARGWVHNANHMATLNAVKIVACLLITYIICWSINIIIRILLMRFGASLSAIPMADIASVFSSLYYSFSPFIIIFGRSSIQKKIHNILIRCPFIR
uniref:Vomeronasal type-1 receptor n=1 Tax=Petromyzon marinus TaxID=7757 RepID=S4S0U4_PETMA